MQARERHPAEAAKGGPGASPVRALHGQDAANGAAHSWPMPVSAMCRFEEGEGGCALCRMSLSAIQDGSRRGAETRWHGRVPVLCPWRGAAGVMVQYAVLYDLVCDCRQAELDGVSNAQQVTQVTHM